MVQDEHVDTNVAGRLCRADETQQSVLRRMGWKIDLCSRKRSIREWTAGRRAGWQKSYFLKNLRLEVGTES